MVWNIKQVNCFFTHGVVAEMFGVCLCSCFGPLFALARVREYWPFPRTCYGELPWGRIATIWSYSVDKVKQPQFSGMVSGIVNVIICCFPLCGFCWENHWTPPLSKGGFVGMAWAGPAASADPLQRSAGRQASPGCLAGKTKVFSFLSGVICIYFCSCFFILSVFFLIYIWIIVHTPYPSGVSRSFSLATTSAPPGGKIAEKSILMKRNSWWFQVFLWLVLIFSSPRSPLFTSRYEDTKWYRPVVLVLSEISRPWEERGRGEMCKEHVLQGFLVWLPWARSPRTWRRNE